MTYDEAVRLRALQLQGGEVHPQLLAEAIETIRTTAGPAVKVPRAREKRKTKEQRAAKRAATVQSAPAPAPADSWPLLTAETEAQVLSASRNAWAVIGRQE